MTRPRIAESFYDESLAFAPTEAQWRDIEQAYGRELGSELRARIERAATTYLQFASAERGAVCKADVKRYIQRTSRQLDPLIALLGKPQRHDSPVAFARARLDGSLSRFKNEAQSLRDMVTGLRELKRTCDDVLLGLSNESGFVPGECWGDFILRLTEILDREELPTRISHETDSDFVLMFCAVQRAFPSEFRRSARVSNTSLAKAMSRAKKAAIQRGHKRDKVRADNRDKKRAKVLK